MSSYGNGACTFRISQRLLIIKIYHEKLTTTGIKDIVIENLASIHGVGEKFYVRLSEARQKCITPN